MTRARCRLLPSKQGTSDTAETSSVPLRQYPSVALQSSSNSIRRPSVPFQRGHPVRGGRIDTLQGDKGAASTGWARRSLPRLGASARAEPSRADVGPVPPPYCITINVAAEGSTEDVGPVPPSPLVQASQCDARRGDALRGGKETASVGRTRRSLPRASFEWSPRASPSLMPGRRARNPPIQLGQNG